MTSNHLNVIGADGRIRTALLCVATNGSENRVYRFDTGRWVLLSSWCGPEATSCSVVGNFAVCTTSDADLALVHIESGLRKHVKCDFVDMTSATAWSDNQGIVAATRGHFALVDPGAQWISSRRLGSYNVSKPGRDILELKPIRREICFLGGRNLLLLYDPDADRFRDLSAAVLKNREIFFRDAAALDEAIFFTCSEGARQLLGRYNSEGLVLWASPLQGTSTPAICATRCELYLASSEILVGCPEAWTSRWSLGDDVVIRLLDAGEFGVCAITFGGNSVFIGESTCKEIPIL